MQAFGLPNTSMITANLVNGTNNFLPQGNLTELIAGDSTPSPVLAATSAPLTSQVNAMTHRYAFGTAGYLEVWHSNLPFTAPCLLKQMQHLLRHAIVHQIGLFSSHENCISSNSCASSSIELSHYVSFHNIGTLMCNGRVD